MVRLIGVEPTRSFEHSDLNAAWLPITPQTHMYLLMEKEEESFYTQQEKDSPNSIKFLRVLSNCWEMDWRRLLP